MRLKSGARPGESVPAVPDASVGGCAFNVAAALSGAGYRVAHAGLRGRDVWGAEVERALRTFGVDDAALVLPDASTGRYVACLNPDGTLALAAAAMEIYDRAGELAAHEPFRAAAGAASMMVLDANASPEVSAGLAEARGGGTELALLATSPRKAPSLAAVLPEADLVFANDAEWDALDARPRLAFVTHGPGGASVVEDGRETLRLPSRARELRSVVGAGDAFAAGVLDARLSSGDHREALERGLDWAALCLASPHATGWWRNE